MKKRINFFAVNDDLGPVLDSLEGEVRLRYTLMGSHTAEKNVTFLRGGDIADLGRAVKDASAKCPCYLVTALEKEVTPRFLRLNSGEHTYSTSQLLNPDSVAFSPAGLWNKNIVLAGSVTTVSDTEDAQRLMKLFDKVLRRTFVKVNAFWVGPSAFSLFSNGARLTTAVQSPPDLDLRIVSH
ncbi:MAG TPA: hypothetical protein VIM98_00430 [Dyella sp.]|uniref:hypothetical protein n=1 Tax=Dyella sp. TaxID=1869338 RepID=UPI002F95467B